VYFHNLLIIWQTLFLISENPCPFASPAFEVTLSGLAGGEYLPLPASKGLAFPFLLQQCFSYHPLAEGQSPIIEDTGGIIVFYNFPQSFKEIEPEKGFLARVVCGENMMFSHVTLQPHTVASLHTHPQEQMGIILEGEFEMTIGEETKMLKKGDMYQVPPNTTHGGLTHSKHALILDVFSPPREGYK